MHFADIYVHVGTHGVNFIMDYFNNKNIKNKKFKSFLILSKSVNDTDQQYF